MNTKDEPRFYRERLPPDDPGVDYCFPGAIRNQKSEYRRSFGNQVNPESREVSPPNRPEHSSSSKGIGPEARKQLFRKQIPVQDSGCSKDNTKAMSLPLNERKPTANDVSVQFIEIFKECNMDKENKFIKEPEKEKEYSPPYTKEFHLLTEVQKARILKVVEDSLRKLANEEYFQMTPSEMECPDNELTHRSSVDRFFRKKFLLPWVLMKVIEMVLCHIIQLTFLSDDTYFEGKKDFIPVVVTYYLTLFIVVMSLVGHITSFSYTRITNPCYFMGIVTSSILTLTTSFGLMLMLTSMEYYRTFHQILVLIFIGILLGLLIVELCLCYTEVKSIWNKMDQSKQYYIT